MLSVFELFSIGIGPSSSHTVGPMRAAADFMQRLPSASQLTRVCVELYGSLAYTGEEHGTLPAIVAGLQGQLPETVDPNSVGANYDRICSEQRITFDHGQSIAFDPRSDLVLRQGEQLPLHSNGMRFSAYADDTLIFSDAYYSIGGGFIITADTAADSNSSTAPTAPYPFATAQTLIQLCQDNQLSIAELVMANETSRCSRAEVREKLLAIARTMETCIEAGCRSQGILPGRLGVKRRAYELHQKLIARGKPQPDQERDMMNWLNLYAIAVNEENAAGGRIVTAPTNGAAGIIPSVLTYYKHYHRKASENGVIDFLLTAGAIGMLYKLGASISGAEVGCQGEVGVACSMAAGALTAVLGGSLAQIENAAEIAMEHHLGMTCDPVAGLVQIPCIERNAMGAVKAVNAARLALLETGEHHVTLDKVIATMRQTGHDMMTIYKETSLGGLAVNVIEC